MTTPPVVQMNTPAPSVLRELGAEYLATLLGALCADLEPDSSLADEPAPNGPKTVHECNDGAESV